MKLAVEATPRPAISKAVPWSTEVRMMAQMRYVARLTLNRPHSGVAAAN